MQGRNRHQRTFQFVTLFLGVILCLIFVRTLWWATKEKSESFITTVPAENEQRPHFQLLAFGPEVTLDPSADAVVKICSTSSQESTGNEQRDFCRCVAVNVSHYVSKNLSEAEAQLTRAQIAKACNEYVITN